MKEEIEDGIANGMLDINDIVNSVIIGFKRLHNIDGLYFYRFLEKPVDCSYYRIISGTGSIMFDHPIKWECSTNPKAKELDDERTIDDYIDIVKEKTPIFFDDTSKRYDNIDDLKHDYFALKLSGICQ